MRKYISYLMFAVAAAFFTGCIDVNVTPIEPQEPTMVTLQLTNADLVATRAITDDDQHNEDLIKSVQCFFSVTDSDAVVYATDLIAVNAQQTKKLEFQIPAEHLSTLFANTATCDVYVVANYGTKIEDNSIADIKDKPITLGTGATQESFVMDGTAKVKLDGTALSGKVELKRAAAKIVVKANIKTSITEGSVTWTPNIARIQMSYLGSVKGSKISAESKDAVITEEDTNPYTQTTDVFEGTTTEQLYVGYQEVPFYSFPVEASANKGEIDITIPWNPGNGDDVLYKYQVPVDIALERNHVYLIEVIVDVLGNAEGATLTPSYVVVNWAENAISTGLSRPKYLVVDETNVVMNNVNSYSVGYASSDDVTAVITSITKPNYSERLESVTTIYSGTGVSAVTPTTGNTNPFNVSVNSGKVVLTHTLNNDNTDKTKFDYVPYTIKVKVTNTTGFEETITFVQYPAMYISVDLNTDYDNDNSVNGNRGYAWVNNSRSTLGNLNGYSTSNENSNPNMITITTNSFNNNDYVIGDPRVGTIDNLSYGNSWASAPALYGTTPRRLTYYYPTNTADAAKNIISPKFRIASSYGLTSTLSMTDAKRRCASYQEDGYPAGRWRVPTAAELKYIVQLSASGYITILFNDGGNYWAADETVYNPSYRNGTVTENTRATSAYVRCVYDEWYWGSEKEKTAGQETLTSFTWGDAPRN